MCVRCRKVICSACCTRLDGINHCHACLKALAARPEPVRKGEFPPLLGAALVGSAGWFVLFGLAWLIQGLLS